MKRAHSLRHFFATTLMSNGVEPQEVQRALRHANLRITLETYVHWMPKRDRQRSLIGQLLRPSGRIRRGKIGTRRDVAPARIARTSQGCGRAVPL
ncbi:tyrosine-type recombinase/integrase [Micromonospora sp. NPDC001898]|uniref:tyrosine-type recombinase/integrase n=1 Tax=Micromonospora sp. NPDC001898 TaxID=3364221 RepID=UPI0036C82499